MRIVRRSRYHQPVMLRRDNRVKAPDFAGRARRAAAIRRARSFAISCFSNVDSIPAVVLGTVESGIRARDQRVDRRDRRRRKWRRRC